MQTPETKERRTIDPVGVVDLRQILKRSPQVKVNTDGGRSFGCYLLGGVQLTESVKLREKVFVKKILERLIQSDKLLFERNDSVRLNPRINIAVVR